MRDSCGTVSHRYETFMNAMRDVIVHILDEALRPRLAAPTRPRKRERGGISFLIAKVWRITSASFLKLNASQPEEDGLTNIQFTINVIHTGGIRFQRHLAASVDASPQGCRWRCASRDVFIISMHSCHGPTLTRPRSRVTIAKTRRSRSAGENTWILGDGAALLAEQDRARRG